MGSDISYWNSGTTATGISQANWNTAYADGNITFAWIRSTRGGTTGVDQPQGTPGGGSLSTLSRRYDDSRFVQNITRAAASGMYAGAYHFARPDIIASTPESGGLANTGADEADHFIQMAGPWMRPGYLLPVFDLEAGQSQRSAIEMAQFSINFSDRMYELMRIRPGMYINGSYSRYLENATEAQRNLIAQPASRLPSMVTPAFPFLWNARYYPAGTDPNTIPVQTGNPKDNPSTLSWFFGPWDDYGDDQPWSFWQYSSIVSIPGFNAVDATVDGNVAQGDIEYIRNYLVPAVWWHDQSGDWSTLTNWNSGQPVVAPVTPPDQATPYASGPLPVPRLPGAEGTGPASGIFDTVIIERPDANITVTLSSGSYDIRKLYVREAFHLNGGNLAIHYDPSYRPDTSSLVRHGGGVSAQFSGPVVMDNNSSLSAHTLQIDHAQVFSLGDGTLAFANMTLMPHEFMPAMVSITGNLSLNALSNTTARIFRGEGDGSSGIVDLFSTNHILAIGNGDREVDVSIEMPITGGGFNKAGFGTLQLTSANSYEGGTIVSTGRLLVNNVEGSGTGSGAVTVHGGVLGGNGTVDGPVTVNAGGTLSAGTETSFGKLTFNRPPSLSGSSFMRINPAGIPSSDVIVVTSGTLDFGGQLVVTNTGPALSGGEVFTLYNATNYAGSFTETALPLLSDGMNWYMGDLTSNGSIQVNRAPVAGNALQLSIQAPNVLEIPIATLIARSSDADGDVLSIAMLDAFSNLGISLTTNATTIFYANMASGHDQFRYVITDGRGGSATGLIEIASTGLPPRAEFAGYPRIDGDFVHVELSAVPGWTYHVERSTNLHHWLTVWTTNAPPEGLFTYMDNLSELKVPFTVYYRLRWNPE